MSANLHIKPVNLANGDLTADDVDLETCSNVATACGPIVSDNCMSALNLHQVQGSDTILTEDIKMETENVKEQTPQVKMEVGSFKPEHPAPCSVSLGTPLDEEFCINQVWGMRQLFAVVGYELWTTGGGGGQCFFVFIGQAREVSLSLLDFIYFCFFPNNYHCGIP